jgi:hypothetical protein
VLALGQNPVRFAVIENKIGSGSKLAKNQMENYPRLIEWLSSPPINRECEFLLLHSVGSSNDLYEKAKTLQANLGKQFGILLWEEALIGMEMCNLNLPGLSLGSHVADCRSALRTHCEDAEPLP